MADALVLDLDNGFIKRMEKADSVLKSMVNTADSLTDALTKTFNSLKGSQFEELISRISGEWKSLGNTKVSPNVDTSKLEDAINIVTNLANAIREMGRKKGTELFDTQNIYATTKGLGETTAALDLIEARIQDLKTKWAEALLPGTPAGFRRKRVDGMLPVEGTAEYDKQVNEFKSKKQLEIEFELRALVEKQAIAKKELQWAKMTQDERLAYVKKTVGAILNESKKELQGAQREYQGVVREMTSLMKTTDSLSSKNNKGALNSQIAGLEQRYAELNARRVELEEQYGAHLVEIAKKANVQILAIEADRILARQKAEEKDLDKRVEAYRSTPQGALDLASTAQTINQMKEAQKYLQIARGDVDVSDVNMIKKLNEEYMRLRATIEALTTAEKNEQSLQPTLRNEYERLLKELDNIAAVRERLAKSEAFASGDLNAAQQMNDVIAREQDILNRVQEIRTAAGNKLLEVDRKHAADRAKIVIDETVKAEEAARKELERVRSISHGEAQGVIAESKQTQNLIQAADAVKKLDEAIRRLDQNDSNYYNDLKELNRELEHHKHNIKMATDSQYALNQAKEIEHKRNTTYSGAISYADNADSIQKQIQAIKYLKEAREKLTVSAAGGQKEYVRQIDAINQRIVHLSANVKALTGDFSATNAVASNLGKMLAGVFSINAIKGYVAQLVRVRGEFELQQRSLHALLQSKDEANMLWQRTTQLALKSPYSVSQLIRSTKQLAAYRIESEKLYKTNKMLSDISAGVGVEVDRLILAYGQVKAANYLRGTELRQFSEAGINILGELANYFSVLEGRAVSVGDVFERVSKRMVSFADVDTVLRKQVEAGGAFYQMQEKQADTLRGSISNLKDQFELMLNDIGQKHDGLLKMSVSGVAFLLKNWESLINVAYAAGAVFAAHRLALMTTNKSYMGMAYHLGIINTLQVKQLSLTQLLSLGYMKLNKAIKGAWKSMTMFIASNPLIAAITAIAVAIAYIGKEIYNHRKEIKEIEEEYENLRNTAKDIDVKFKIAIDEGDMDEARTQLSNLLSSAENDYKLNFKVNTNNLDLDQIQQKYSEIYATIYEANILAEKFAKLGIQEDYLFGQSLQGGFEWGDMLSLDLTQYQKSFRKTFSLIKEDLNDVILKLREKKDTMSEIEKEAYEKLNPKQSEGETEEAYYSRIINAYTALQDQIEKVGAKSNKVNRSLRRLAKRYAEMSREMNTLFDNLNIDESLPNEEKEVLIKVAIDKYAYDKGYSDILESLYDLANQRWSINIKPTLTVDKNVTPEWVKRVRPAIEGINKELTEKYPELAQMKFFAVPTDTDDLQTYISTVKSQISEAKQSFAQGQQIFSQEEVDRLKSMSEYVERVETILNIVEKNGKEQDAFSQKLRVIKEMYEEYKKLLKLFSDAEAKEGAMAKVGDAFKEAFGKTPNEMVFDLFSEEGVKKALNELVKLAPDAKARLQAQLAKTDIEWEGNIKIAENKYADLSKDIETLFSGYELSLELEKLNIPPDFASKLFGLEALSLEDLKTRLHDVMKGEVDSENNVALYKKYLEKIETLEAKAQQDRLKKYLNYSRNAIGERAKIKLEELRQLSEIEETFTKAKTKEGLSDADRAMIEEQRKLAIEGVKKESKDKLNKQEWEDFKSSELFINLFQDLDNASDALLNHTINKIREFKAEWTDMPIESAKEMSNKLQELELALMDTGRAAKDMKALKSFLEEQMTFRGIEADATVGSKSNKALAEAVYNEQVALEADIALSQQRISVLKTINSLTAENKQQELEKLGITEQYLQSLLLSSDVIGQSVKDNEDLIADDKQKISDNQRLLNTTTKILNAQNKQKQKLEEQADAIGKTQKMASDLYEAFSELSDIFSDGDGLAKIFADMGSSMLDTVLNTIQLQLQLKTAQASATGLGLAMNTAMGVVGWIVMAVQLLATVLKAVFDAHDKALENQIENLLTNVEVLEKEFEKLEKAMDKAFSTEQIAEYSKAMRDNINARIEDLKKAEALESQKKKSDEDEIKRLQEEQEKLQEDLYDMWAETNSKATAGIMDDALSAAEDFVDAWLEAFKETGDGLSGLKDNFQEMLTSLLKRQAALQIVGKFTDDYSKWLNEYVNAEIGDTELTPEEAKEWASRIKETLPNLSALLESFFDGAGELLETGSGLSELSKGIQGVTETTAQVIEAYLNSVRFYVADSNSKLATLVTLMGGDNAIANPMVEQLRLIVEQTKAIHSLLSDVTKDGHTMGGRGIRVFMD